jgi:hypothetical protein
MRSEDGWEGEGWRQRVELVLRKCTVTVIPILSA